MVRVPNSNIISDSAQPELKEKYKMFEPELSEIKKPNGSPYRAKGSKPGSGAKDKTAKKNKY